MNLKHISEIELSRENDLKSMKLTVGNWIVDDFMFHTNLI